MNFLQHPRKSLLKNKLNSSYLPLKIWQILTRGLLLRMSNELAETSHTSHLPRNWSTQLIYLFEKKKNWITYSRKKTKKTRHIVCLLSLNVLLLLLVHFEHIFIWQCAKNESLWKKVALNHTWKILQQHYAFVENYLMWFRYSPVTISNHVVCILVQFSITGLLTLSNQDSKLHIIWASNLRQLDQLFWREKCSVFFYYFFLVSPPTNKNENYN